MHSNIAIELLKTFSKDELKRFEEYISSPFFNKSKVLIKLFNILVKYHPDFSSPVIGKEKLFKKLYPDKAYNEQSLRNRMAELSEMIKNFMAFERFDKNEIQKKQYYIEALTQKQKYKLGEQAATNLMQSLKQNEILDVDHFLHKLQTLEKTGQIFFSLDDESSKRFNIVIEKGENLINYFLIYIMQVFHDTTVNLQTTNTKIELNITNEFLESFNWQAFLDKLKEKNYKYYNLIYIYYNMYKNLKNYTEENYYNLKRAIFEEFDKYSKTDQFNFIIFLLHTIYNELAFKNPQFYREGFELNKFALSKNIYMLDHFNHFPSVMFWSISNNAMNVDEFGWLEEFVKEYSPLLNPEERNNMYYYVMAKIYWRKKNYDDSLEALSKIDYNKVDDIQEKIHLKLLYLMNYYELGIDSSLFSLIDSYKHYLTDNKEVPEYLKHKLKNALKYFTIVSKAKFDHKPIEYADYVKAKENPDFYQRKWLLDEIEKYVSKK